MNNLPQHSGDDAQLARSEERNTLLAGLASDWSWETDEQIGLIKALGCDRMQGYRLGWPVPAEDFEAVLCAS